MSIDHTCVGYGKSEADEWCLRLMQRNGPIDDGSRLFAVTNPPKDSIELDLFVDAELWSTGTIVMVGNDQIACRDGYCGLTLVPDWRTILGNYWKRKAVA